MPSPVDELREMRERLAREWAKDCQREGKLPAYGIAAQAAAEHILATTTEPTMADVEWDNEKHRGLGAVDEAGQGWVMLQDDGGYINCIGLDLNPVGAERGDLTPNGKRYELVEVTDKPAQADEPEYPETLTTVEDYENAPVGTIVALNGCLPYVKRGRNDWSDAFGDTCSDKGIAGHTREVLRWGWDA